MNNKLYWFRICLSYFDINLDLSFTLWSYSLSDVTTGCSSTHCKECQTQHSIHNQIACKLEGLVTKFIFKSSNKQCDRSWELHQSKLLWQREVSLYGCACRKSSLCESTYIGQDVHNYFLLSTCYCLFVKRPPHWLWCYWDEN